MYNYCNLDLVTCAAIIYGSPPSSVLFDIVQYYANIILCILCQYCFIKIVLQNNDAFLVYVFNNVHVLACYRC